MGSMGLEEQVPQEGSKQTHAECGHYGPGFFCKSVA